ncbi:MAG: VWA domain-containing protein [Flavobacteriaceae bacterium]|nr:VWA domain-containing protein [Flavobacteriaceae bacterium]
MDTKLYLLILLAALIALVIAVFQYLYKQKDRSNIHIGLAFLRFLSVFLLLLLLINPTIESQKLELIKPKLALAVDNSSSIKVLENDRQVNAIVQKLSDDPELKEKFAIELFSFDEEINRLDSLSFSVNKTNIINSLRSLDNLYDTSDAIVLLTDGNQTLGSDYSFYKTKPSTYPVAVGDTIPQNDLKISKLNVNRYSFLNNTFPVEVFINYSGNTPVSTNLTISDGTRTIYRRTLSLDQEKNSERVIFNITADRVGAINYRASVSPISSEINRINNRTNFIVEIIDEQSKIALISDITHPDLGMIKRSIETNKQRKVELLTPDKATNLKEYQLVILYQPSGMFRSVFQQLQDGMTNYFIISGMQTDWNFLNRVQEDFIKNTINQSEQYQASRNTAYASFVIDAFDFESLPPLDSKFGTINFKTAHETILFQNINNIQTEKPLLATFSKNNRRGAILLGEGIWKWRAYSYTNGKSFFEFDRFINKLIQYLSIKKKLNRLDLDYEPIVYQNDIVTINATYFDTNYIVDTRASLNLTLRNTATDEVKTFPFRLSGQSYISSISDLESGDYAFTVSVEGQSTKRSGSFTVLDYNIEQQFTFANMNALRSLANNSNGKFYHTSGFDSLLEDLKNDTRYKPIQRSTLKQQAFIDWKWLLGLAALFLSLEWFIRKYHGKI